MLLILMYHRAGEGVYGNTVPVLRSHFTWLKQRYPVVLPGEPLPSGRLSVCLTFDDAYADFYFHVFPLLREFSLRAVLAVPTAFILPETSVATSERLGISHHEAMEGDLFRTKAPFCTWRELREMTDSGRVQAASHTHRHLNMALAEVDVGAEAAESKVLLEKRLGRPATTFIYPFGQVNARAFRAVREHYQHDIRVGAALNRAWQPRRQPLCRVEGDGVPDIRRLFRPQRLAGYWLKWGANRLRAAAGKWQRG